MASPTPVMLSQRDHGSLGWVSSDPFTVLRNLVSVPVGGAEALRAATSVPLVFRLTKNGTYDIQALLGGAGQFPFPYNPLPYVPFAIRFYPFTPVRVAANDHTKTWQLGVYNDPDVVVATGRAFFDAAGAISATTRKVADQFKQYCTDLDRAQAQAAQLFQAGVLMHMQGQPVHLKIINPQALDALDDQTLGALFRTGALQMAQAVLMSGLHLIHMKKPIHSQTLQNQPPPTSGFMEAILTDLSHSEDMEGVE
ncbi:MAG: SapC family protein [Pseudomonadota bacterium]